MRNTFLLIASSVMMFPAGATAEQIKDLSPFETVKLDVELKTLDTAEPASAIFYSVANNYSNSIICSVDVSVPVTKDGVEGFFEVSQSDVVIFPFTGFSQPLSYRIDSSKIPANRVVQPGIATRLKGAATCSGWSLGQRLPRRTCLALNPNHDQICANVRSAGRDYYPVIRGLNAHLGDCGC
jgi:hypothetical protein